MNNIKEYIESLTEKDEELVRQRNTLEKKKWKAEEICKNLVDTLSYNSISNIGHENDDFNIWGGGVDHRSPLPEDPVAAKLNLAVKLSGRPFVYRSVYASVRNLMLDRKLPFEVYEYFFKTSVEDIHSQVEALSLRPEYQTVKQKKIVKKSIKNGLVSAISHWPTKAYDSSGNRRLGVDLFCALCN